MEIGQAGKSTGAGLAWARRLAGVAACLAALGVARNLAGCGRACANAHMCS